MEERDKKAACLMLNVDLDTGVDISTVLDENDIDFIERDPHVTIFYGPSENPINKDRILDDIKDVLEEDYFDFIEFLKKEEDESVLKYFTLGNFENPDADYLVLKLNDDNIVSDNLKLIQKVLTRRYDILLSFSVFRPHVTLAKLKPGSSQKYMSDEGVKRIVENSRVSFEDFVFSVGYETEKFKKYNLTTFHTLSRHFRLEEMKKLYEEIDIKW